MRRPRLRSSQRVWLLYLTDLTNDEQKRRWLPGVVRGDLISAIGMTEPNASSDVAGIRTSAADKGDRFLVNGAKTFITNGQNADVVITAVRTSLDRHRGPRSSSSSAACRVSSAGGTSKSSGCTVRKRTAFGKPIGALQNTRFALANVATEVSVAEAFIDRCVIELNAARLTPADAAKAKLWATEMEFRCLDACHQLFGGYGYMREYPITRAAAERARDAHLRRDVGDHCARSSGVISGSVAEARASSDGAVDTAPGS